VTPRVLSLGPFRGRVTCLRGECDSVRCSSLTGAGVRQ